MSNTKESDTKELFENIAKFMANNRSLLSKGAEVEIAGLDLQIQQLCAQVLELSAEESAKYADLLQTLFDDLTELGKDLEAGREALAHEIRYLSSHKKANVAYKTADATDGFSGDTKDNNEQ